MGRLCKMAVVSFLRPILFFPAVYLRYIVKLIRQRFVNKMTANGKY